ncbi:hypothetical protein QCA50_015125 [Cerrena zonata]|uniref:Uncharacterized protein n=1 Tax=Cerrena zonata TaxID=2478898 RepID=A0AAW0FKW2_9APHY
MRAPVAIPFLAILTLLSCILINVPTTCAEKNPNAAATSVDRADQNNIQELLRTLPTFGDAKQKFLDIVHGGMENPGFNFWEQTELLGQKVQKYSESLLEDAKSQVQEASGRIEEVKQIAHELIASANHLQTDMLTNGVTTESLSQDLEDALLPILEKFYEMFPAPEQAPDHDERERAVRELLDKIEEKIIAVGTKHGLDEAVLRKHTKNILPLILKLVVLIGDLSSQHPILRNILIVTVVLLILPDSWFLRPILRVFGFGPAGPIKGTAASWSQKYFYGAAVNKGALFSKLQKAGMTGIPYKTARTILGGIGGLGLAFWRCL